MTFREVPIGVAFEVRNGATSASDEASYWDGDIPWVTPADLGALIERRISSGARSITVEGYSSCGTQMVPANSILLSTRAPIGHLAVADCDMCFNQGCRGLVPREMINAEFAYWALLARRPLLEAAGQGATFVELSRTKLRRERISLPDLDTQKAIATFLDRETARIDQLIEKKSRFSALAEERWRSTLDDEIKGRMVGRKRAATKNNSFISELPEQWALTPLKYLVDLRRPVMYGIVLPGPDVDDGVLIVKGGDVKPDRLSPDSLCRTTREIEAGYARSRLRGGDLVIAIRGGIGDVEIVPPEIEGANLTQDAARIAPRRGVFNRWLRYGLQAPSVFAPLAAGANGAAVRGINIFDLDRVLIPTPTEAEQISIAERLSIKEKEIRRMREKITEHAELIRELRSALIVAAVTGQIDVVSWSKRGEADRRLDAIQVQESCA